MRPPATFGDSPLDATALEIIEAFEQAWEKSRPSIEEHFGRHPERAREEAFSHDSSQLATNS